MGGLPVGDGLAGSLDPISHDSIPSSYVAEMNSPTPPPPPTPPTPPPASKVPPTSPLDRRNPGYREDISDDSDEVIGLWLWLGLGLRLRLS